MKHPESVPSLVFADQDGNICDFHELSMVGKSNTTFVVPDLEDLIPLPEGSELFVLPGRLPVGADPQTGEPLLLEENPYQEKGTIQAVAAFMAPAYTALLGSAYQKESPQAPRLPLFAYSAVGWYKERFWVAGFRCDRDIRQDTSQFNRQILEQKTAKKLNQFKNNRLVQHLGKCCLTYCCPAAQNYFLERWEAPLPTSPHCNARCLGCISLQPSGSCPSTQQRITFVPSPDEVAEIAVHHIAKAERPVVSFGQGCEGEPLLQADVIEKAIRKIRQTTAHGTINLNSNSSRPDKIARLATAGLDSLRVSLNSVQENYYSRYYSPQGYSFSDVLKSIEIMKDAGKFVSFNYFILPGFTDSPAEFENLCKIISRYKPDLLQLRNLNIDPEWYLDHLHFPVDKEGIPGAMGMRNWKDKLSLEFPQLKYGYFNPYLN